MLNDRFIPFNLNSFVAVKPEFNSDNILNLFMNNGVVNKLFLEKFCLV